MRVELGLCAALTTGCVADNPVFMVDPDGAGSTGGATSSSSADASSGPPADPSTGDAAGPTSDGASATDVTSSGETSSGATTTTSADATTAGETSSGEPAVCGDGVVAGDEQCDHGADNGEGAACTPTCAAAACGDGLLWVGDGSSEQCDDGPDNADDAACTSACQTAVCGDGLVLAAGDEPEACDDGPDNGWALGHCSPDCRAAIPATALKIFRTPPQQGLKGNLAHPDGVMKAGGVVSADEACELLAGDGTRAMIVEGGVRRATIDAWVGGEQGLGWVLKPYTGYANADGALIGVTGREALLGVRNGEMLPLIVPITPGQFYATRTGMLADWRASGKNCGDWKSTLPAVFATYGDSGTASKYIFQEGMVGCAEPLPIYCVEQ
ncbi:MAG: DUF1554 domain-containing protein [Myxococcales bacterium]|nr:DUF1554 domain-containing protein [Myxococcales bacterium]